MAANIGGVINFGGFCNTSGGLGDWAGIAGLKSNAVSNDYSGYLTFYARTTGQATAERLRIDQSGNVGIGTTSPQYKLAVDGTIGAKEVIASVTGWSDYVFKPGYRLKPLKEIAAYIRANHHLPGIPSETDIQEKGVSVGEMQAKLLAKLEELTLHVIQEHERNDRLEQQNREILAKVARLLAH